MTTVGGIDPGFTGQVSGGEPPYVRLPDPSTLFAARARRFATVAEHHDIGDYLRFLATVAEAQHTVASETAPIALPADMHDVIEHGMPPLSAALASQPVALATFDALLARLGVTLPNEGPGAVVAMLVAMSAAERAQLLITVGDGLFEIERLGESAIAAAALQVWYALHAARLDMPRLRNIGETICPCCGGTPASSMVVAWPDATGNRYLSCSLCCAMWNHVRVKCTACGSTKGISYRSIEGGTGEVAGEVCEACHCYAKHLSQTKNAQLDPIADDIASYGLDMMLREDGWRRTGLNPFLILT